MNKNKNRNIKKKQQRELKAQQHQGNNNKKKIKNIKKEQHKDISKDVTESTKISKNKSNKSHKCRHIIEALVMIIIIICAVVGISIGMFQHQKKYYANHVRHHMTSISTNTLALGNKHFNGKHTIIFYEDSCPHCQKVIPKIYAKNRLDMKHIQYRDDVPSTIDYNNQELGAKLGVRTVPTEVHLLAHHGKIIHYTKTTKLD